MRPTLALILPLIAFALGACGNDDAKTPGADGAQSAPAPAAGEGDAPDVLERVVYAGSNWYGHAPTWVGIEQGIFAAAGFDVEDTVFGSSPDRLAALQIDNAQFASLGEVAMLMAMSNDQQGFYWIGNQDIAPGNEGLVAIGIDRIEDLRGKSIAVNLRSSVHITAAQLLAQHGIDINDPEQITVKHGADSAVVDLVRSGECQAGIIWEPFFTDLRNLPDAKLLGTDADTDIYTRFKTMTGPDVICCSKSWFDADPARAKRLLRAYFEAVLWCKEHPEELIDLIAKHVRKPRDGVAATMKNFRWLTWDDQPVVMSDAVLFGQAQMAAETLVRVAPNEMKAVPDFRKWARADVFND